MEEKIRCNCGCFMATEYYSDENSGEMYEAQCNNCGKSERGIA